MRKTEVTLREEEELLESDSKGLRETSSWWRAKFEDRQKERCKAIEVASLKSFSVLSHGAPRKKLTERLGDISRGNLKKCAKTSHVSRESEGSS